jgi:hypothetical protein
MPTTSALIDTVLIIVCVATSVMVRRALAIAEEIAATASGVERLPRFRLPIHGTDRVMRRADLLGANVALLFVDEATSETESGWQGIRASIRYLAARHEAAAVLVFHPLDGTPVHDLNDIVPGTTVLIDGKGTLAQRCRVRDTPSAQIFDGHGRLLKSGTMLR